MSAKGVPVMAKKKTQSEDAIKKILAQKLSVEAQRISNILRNCISEVEIAASLPSVLRLNSESSIVDKELSRALQKHQILEERLETLEGLKLESGGEQEEEVGKEKAQLETDIKNSVRDLLRVIRARPGAISGLRAEESMEVRASESLLIRGLQRFHSQLVKKLQASPDEEIQLVVPKQEPSSPAYSLDYIISVEQDMATALKEIDGKISRRKSRITSKQCYLKGYKKQDGYTSHVSGKPNPSHIKTSDMMDISIQQEIDQLDSQLNNLILKNTQEERLIQEKNEMLETEIENLLKIFDDEMEENQANLEVNEKNYEREEEELKKLEKPFSVLEVECNQIHEKRRLAEEKRKEEIKELELKTKAAIFAQAWWRGYSTRKALKNKGKSKKAKKGKGKKTK